VQVLVAVKTSVNIVLYFYILFRFWGLFSWGLKGPGREADHSTPFSAEIKNS
jgi:nicotinamide riboside transporter PnuC